jgi:hypothetical protein
LPHFCVLLGAPQSVQRWAPPKAKKSSILCLMRRAFKSNV